MRLLVYALGGGLGHLQRSLALCRSASRCGHESVILTNSPAWPRIATNLPLPGVRVQHLAGSEDQILAVADQELQAGGFDCLLVDTLPRGIRGELAGRLPDVPCAFVHRDLTADYANQASVREAVARFDLMLCPGEQGPLTHRNAVVTDPWVLFEASELLSRTAVRRHFACPSEAALVVVGDAVDPDEAAGLAAVAHVLRHRLSPQAHVHQATLEDSWPLQRFHLGIDLLIGAAGYNTVHEARLTQTPLRAIPRQRLYDRQDRRLLASEWFDVQDLQWPLSQVRPHAAYRNGTHAALQAIERIR